MEEIKMKKLTAILVMFMLIAVSAYAKGYEVTKDAGPFKVTVALDKNPAITGDNMATITIKDASGKVIPDAKLKVDYSMPAMPGMPAMNYKAALQSHAGMFMGNLNFSMPGSWSVNIKIDALGKTGKTKLNIDVQ